MISKMRKLYDVKHNFNSFADIIMVWNYIISFAYKSIVSSVI